MLENSKNTPFENSDLEKRILAYFYENPTSSESLEDIIYWWIVDSNVRKISSEIKTVIAALVEKKLIIVKQREQANNIRYQINEKYLTIIQDIIDP